MGLQGRNNRHLTPADQLPLIPYYGIDASLGNVDKLGKLMNMSSVGMIPLVPSGSYYAFGAEISMLYYHREYPFGYI